VCMVILFVLCFVNKKKKKKLILREVLCRTVKFHEDSGTAQ
jgi:hypothetical protein